MTLSMTSAQTQKVLDALYLDAKTNDPLNRQGLENKEFDNAYDRFAARKQIYMPVDREFGNLMYAMAKSMKAKNIVEFGTSFGISTIFLAAAVKDNGGGVVITTEFIPEKAETAKKNLTEANLSDVLEFRVGDALKTLATEVPSIDMVFLDGEKSMYLDILKLIEPKLRPGCIIAADNTDTEGVKNFLEYVRESKNGYISSAVLTPGKNGHRAHEVSIKL